LESNLSAVVFKAQPHGEYDKLLKLITKDGVVSAVIKGVRRQKAKLKPCALPFAFFEYSAVKKGEIYTITGASQIEDLHGVSACPNKLTCASIMLEAAAASFGAGADGQFVVLLRMLKHIIYGDNPFIPAIRFLQYMIHSSGYGYDYERYDRIETPLQLLSYLHFLGFEESISIKADSISNSLIEKTLFKIITSFENRFDYVFHSKVML